MYIPGQEISYQVIKQKLTLNKNNYNIGDTIIGYFDAEFVSSPHIRSK
jgi:hypothetical protein